MATVIGGIATSHIPAIGAAIAAGRQSEPYWKPFFDGYPPVHAWLAEHRPDVAVVVYNDHGLNFFLDAMPTFAVGAAERYENRDEGWGLSPVPPFDGSPELSCHLVETLVDRGFDITICQEMVVDHGFVVPMTLLYPPPARPPVRVVPVCLNMVQHPLPRPDRCLALGRAIGRAVAELPSDDRVLVLGTGGMSHQLDGDRAGFINPDFDRQCLDAMVADPEWIAAMSVRDLIERAGAQGVEIMQWLVMRGALGDHVTERHRNYHLPVSNTGAGLLLLEPAA